MTDVPHITDTCRLCATSHSVRVSIFSKEGDSHQLKHKLRICVPVIVRQDDDFPQQVCISCLSLLDQTYDFYQKVKAAQHKLKAIIDVGNHKKRRLSDTHSPENSKRICFGSTKLTYTRTPSDLLNEDQDSNQERPPLFVVMKETSPKDTGESLVAEKRNVSATSLVEPENDLSTAEGGNTSIKSTMPGSPNVRSPSSPDSQEPNGNVKANPANSDTTCIDDNTPSYNTKSDVTHFNSKSRAESLQSTSKQTVPSSSLKKSDKCKNLKQEFSSPIKNPVCKGVPSETSGEKSAADKSVNEIFKPCPICKCEFDETTLAAHIALHNKGVSTYPCELCRKCFFNFVALTRHMDRRHNQVPS